MNSKELLEKAKQAYYNVQHKEYSKRDFIAGYLIGYAEQLHQYNIVGRSEQLVCDNHKPDLEHFMKYSESICKNCKQKV